MNIFEELEWRGLLQDVSDRQAMEKLPSGQSFYVGFDPTASSLHFGNLLQITTATRLAKFGYKPVMLFGGATGSIGDPSGKRSERPLLSREQINANVAKHTATVQNIMARAGASASYVNNLDWTHEVSILDFLRDVGKHFTVNYMLSKDSVSQRISSEVGISFTEFSYMLLQAWDFYHLYEKYGVKIQFGGSDQWGNITAGLELIRKKCGGEAYAFSLPLILDSQGKKLGKSESGAIWLDASLLSPFKFHQYCLNISDVDAPKLLRSFTFLTREEILNLEESAKSAPEKRIMQKALADSMCEFVHGKEALESAQRCAQVLFGGSLEGLSEGDLLDIFSDAPSTTISRSEIETTTLFDLFHRSGLAKSKGEARRLVDSGGAYLNNERITDGAVLLNATIAKERNIVVIRSGKKQYQIVQIKD